MIRIRRPGDSAALDERTRKYLAKRQEKASVYERRSKEIGKAWKNFLRTDAKMKVAVALDGCTYAKCSYCEQVAAKDIEHFYPKSDFPRQMFKWTNFLRGCKNCNNAKRDQFPMNDTRPLLIDPSREEPLDFFRWDFVTGRMVPNPNDPFQSCAVATRDMFDIDQEPLCDERRLKLKMVLYLLRQVLDEDPVSAETKARLKDELSPKRPWLGIVRQLFVHSGPFQGLVRRARKKLPEIEGWTAPWI
jgi:uncharacterized protein (TIGR02646 family)